MCRPGRVGAEAGDDGGVGLQRQLEAEDVDGATLVEGQADLADAPGEREQRHIVKVLRQQRRAGEGQGGGAVAVEDGVNLLGGGGVGHGEHVVADLRDAHGAAFDGML